MKKKTETKTKPKIQKEIQVNVPLSDLFDGVEDDINDIEVKKTGYKLDIFEVLKAINRKDWDYYKNLDDDVRKGVPLYPILRWLACPADRVGITSSQLYLINNFINYDYWVSSKHPDLVWKSYCAMGTPKLNRGGMTYTYIKANMKKGYSIDAIFLECNSKLGDPELAVLKSRMTRDKYIALLKDMGKQDKVIKELVADYDKYNEEK